MANACFLALPILMIASPAIAQQPASDPAPFEPAPAILLPANTAVTLRMNSDLSSKSAREGAMFDLSVADAVMVDGNLVIPRNARAVGEVTWLTGKGAFGKSGKMNIELRYVDVAGQRIPITGSYRQEGEGNTAATIGGVIAVGVFAGFITGRTAIIPAGRELKAFTTEDVAFATPRPRRLPAPAYAAAPPVPSAARPTPGNARTALARPADSTPQPWVNPDLTITIGR